MPNGSLDALSSCNYEVTFTPGTETSESGSLSIAVAEDPRGGPPAVTLTGSGITPLRVTPLVGISFGNIVVGKSSRGRIVTVFNNGAATVALSTLIGGVNVTSFARAATTCGPTLAGGGASCTYTLSFTPIAPGPASATFAVSADGDAASPHNVNLTGNGM